MLEWFKDYNATQAYRRSHPRCQSDIAAATGGYQTLRKPHIQAFMAEERARRFRRLELDGDEALGLIALTAVADITQLFGGTHEDGTPRDAWELRPPEEWPDYMRRAVKSVKWTKEGPHIVLHDALKAQELLAIAAGKLKNKFEVDAGPTLAELLDPSISSEQLMAKIRSR